MAIDTQQLPTQTVGGSRPESVKGDQKSGTTSTRSSVSGVSAGISAGMSGGVSHPEMELVFLYEC